MSFFFIKAGMPFSCIKKEKLMLLTALCAPSSCEEGDLDPTSYGYILLRTRGLSKFMTLFVGKLFKCCLP